MLQRPPPFHQAGFTPHGFLMSRRLLPTATLLACLFLAPDTRSEGAEPPGEPAIRPQDRNHWAFRPLVRPPVPTVTHADRVRTPVDAFILRRLELQRLKPAPEVD